MKGVLGDSLVGVDRTQALKGHNLIVGGITGCILNDKELKRQIQRQKIKTTHTENKTCEYLLYNNNVK